MENKFASLEAESVKKADTYLSIAKKTAIVKLLAPGCIEQVDVLPKSENANVQPIPPRWQENILGKRLIMSYVLAGIYLHLIDVNGLYNSETPKFEFTARQYDIFSKTYGQLEGMKRDDDPEVRAHAAAILSDYRDFEKLLNAEIYNLLQAKNDLLSRVVMLFTEQSTESIQNVLDALHEVQTEAEAQARKSKEWLEHVRAEKGE